jgi:hypothetical protein
MFGHANGNVLVWRRRDLIIGAGALLMATPARAPGILEDLTGDMERLKGEIEGDIKGLREDVRQEVAYL